MAATKEPQGIKIAAVGRPFKLGMLYDCRTEKLVPGITLWDKSTLEENLILEPQKAAAFKVITKDNIENKAHALDINANLRLSCISGMIEVSGSAKYLDDRTSSSHQERITLDYKCTTVFESLTMAHLAKGNFEHPDVFISGDATHVVTGIQYGAHAVLLFDKEHSDSESNRDVQGSVKALVDKIPKINLEGDAEVKLSEKDKMQAESLNVQFYGDFIPPINPTTYLEAVNLYKTLPELLGTSDKNAVPLIVWLYPLCRLDSKACKLVREINSTIVNNITKVLEQLHEYETTCNDLLKTNACNSFAGLKRQIWEFKEMIFEYRIAFQRQLLPVLPEVRGGGAEESELIKILKEREKSPFGEKWFSHWLQEKQSEVKILDRYIDTLSGIDIAKKTGDLDAVCMDPSNKHVICFTIFRPAGDLYLSAMKAYLQNPDVHLQAELVIKKAPTDQSMIHNSRAFLQFFKSNNVTEKRTKFVIAEQETESVGTSGHIYLYIDGILSHSKFVPPSSPGNLSITDVKPESVELSWVKPDRGEEHVTEYEIMYEEESADSGLSIKCKTLNCIVENLQPNTKYKFKVRAYSVASFSEFSEAIASTLPGENSDGTDGGPPKLLEEISSVSLLNKLDQCCFIVLVILSV